MKTPTRYLNTYPFCRLKLRPREGQDLNTGCEKIESGKGRPRPFQAAFPSFMGSQRCSLPLHRYYAFDEAFVREVLGKKLSKGTKKDLDDISTKTGITLKSCRRQVGTAPFHAS